MLCIKDAKQKTFTYVCEKALKMKIYKVPIKKDVIQYKLPMIGQYTD